MCRVPSFSLVGKRPAKPSGRRNWKLSTSSIARQTEQRVGRGFAASEHGFQFSRARPRSCVRPVIQYDNHGVDAGSLPVPFLATAATDPAAAGVSMVRCCPASLAECGRFLCRDELSRYGESSFSENFGHQKIQQLLPEETSTTLRDARLTSHPGSRCTTDRPTASPIFANLSVLIVCY